MLAFDDAEVRAVGAQVRAWEQAVRGAAGVPLQPNHHGRRDKALEWLAATARRWAWRGWTGLPERLGRLSAADIDRLLTCLVSLARALGARGLGLIDVTRLRIAAVEGLRRLGRRP
jgi:hypothetical protein